MASNPSPVRTYAEFIGHHSLRQRARTVIRDQVVAARSLGRSIGRHSGFIAFPYYHHIFADERASFARQLDYLRQFGEFVSLDEAVSMLASGAAIDGRYFCVTFDDGFKNVQTHAQPIMSEKKVPLAVYLPTRYIGTSLPGDEPMLRDFFAHRKTLIDFLTWDDVRQMVGEGVTFGSHTVHHLRLSGLTDEQARTELVQSKEVIEAETGIPCPHFCSPFGVPVSDFSPTVHPALAESVGYRSFVTTGRGVNKQGKGFPVIRRDHVLANWSTAQLRYFFGV